MLIRILTDLTASLILLINTYTDIKRREVLLSTVIAGGAAGILFSFYNVPTEGLSASSLFSWTAGLLPGLLLLILSFVLPAQIGTGDALLILSLGSLLGGRRILSLLFASLSLSCIFSIILLIMKKAGRKSTIPFVPFLFAALPICCILKL